MKKTLAFLMATSMLASMPLAAYATGSQTGTTTLTTTIQPATYTLNVPAEVTIAPGNTTQTNIGSVTVSDASGFSPYKGLEITSEPFDHLRCDSVDTYIQYYLVDSNSDDAILSGSGKGVSGGYLSGNAEGGLNTVDGMLGYEIDFLVYDENQWQKAKAGKYTSTITFTAEVVYQEN